MAVFVGSLAAKRRFTHISVSELATHPKKHPPVGIPKTKEWQRFVIRTEARGKECRLILAPEKAAKKKARNGGPLITIRFRAGMVGCGPLLCVDGISLEKC